MPTSHVFPEVKDPQEIITYAVLWSSWLSPPGDPPTGDTISGAPVWTVPGGITKVGESNTTTKASIVLSGGTAGTDYDLLCHITTAQGAQGERTVTVQVRDK